MRPVDSIQLLKKCPIMSQGLLALKNDTAVVQFHSVSGNNGLAHRSLPFSEGNPTEDGGLTAGRGCLKDDGGDRLLFAVGSALWP
ncbi:hypothetical protein CB1_000258028 [Camelus ferus]|nr:hypothetical protein CB1_000258028 [Camelus ferus]